MHIHELLNFAQQNQASDIHLSSGSPPVLRVLGNMVPLRMSALSDAQVREMLYTIMSAQQRKEFEKDLEIDFAFGINENVRYRVNAFHNLHGAAAVMREIPVRVRTLEELQLPPVLNRICEMSKGLVLVTGPTGSGKSTTLAAMINQINYNLPRHIVTIEDPIEFVHSSQKSLINQREVGTHTNSFARALKSVLREDPDVILVGEMRDMETISLALTAAETGHLVFGTLHTSSASSTIDRIIDVFPTGDKEMVRTMLSISLQAVVAQLLVRSSDGKRRFAVHEIMLANPAIRNLIRDNKIPQVTSLIQVGMKQGMQTMKDSVTALLDRGVISRDEARYALNMAHLNADSDDESGDPDGLTTKKTGF